MEETQLIGEDAYFFDICCFRAWNINCWCL